MLWDKKASKDTTSHNSPDYSDFSCPDELRTFFRHRSGVTNSALRTRAHQKPCVYLFAQKMKHSQSERFKVIVVVDLSMSYVVVQTSHPTAGNAARLTLLRRP